MVLPDPEDANAVVLPPLENKSELKCHLLKLRQIQVNTARTQFNLELDRLRETHVSNEDRRQDALKKAEDRARRREAKQERIRKKHYSATKVQALVRSFFVRAFVLPSFLEAKAKRELKKSRMALSDTMLGLHQNIHDLAFLEEDRHVSSTRIQAWWRGVLAKRMVAIVLLRHHLIGVGMRMAKAATRIQAHARGRQARMSCKRLRKEREKRMAQERKKKHDRMVAAIIKVQSHVRRRSAVKRMQARREFMSKELEGEGASAEARERGEGTSKRSPERGEKSRRRARVNTESGHGRGVTGTGQGHAHSKRVAVAEGDTRVPRQQGVGFEDGGMLVEEHHPEPHSRKTMGGKQRTVGFNKSVTAHSLEAGSSSPKARQLKRGRQTRNLKDVQV